MGMETAAKPNKITELRNVSIYVKGKLLGGFNRHKLFFQPSTPFRLKIVKYLFNTFQSIGKFQRIGI